LTFLRGISEAMAESRGTLSTTSPAPRHFLRRYIFSTDHKVIGLQFYLLGLLAVLIGVLCSSFIRLHLAWPHLPVPLLGHLSPTGAPGGVISPEYYLSLLTLHGTLMIFFVLTTVPQSGFGNLLLASQIGACRMAFPRLNMLSFWLTFVSLCVLLSTYLISDGPPISGWTAYPPLSAIGSIAGPGEGLGQTLWLISIAIFCAGSLLGALNFIATTLYHRAPGMTWIRLPLTVWAWFITAILIVLSFLVLLAADGLLLSDRLAGTSFFVPAGLVVSDQLLAYRGGSPLLWQNLFWFFAHPEVYITILPGMAIVSHVLSVLSRRPVFGYRETVASFLGIGALSFAVWGHHMFATGMNPFMTMSFATLSMVISIPSAVTTFSWLGTLWRGRIEFRVPLLFALGFVSIFVTGGLSGLLLAQPSLDLYLQGTYFVVAHLHMVMGTAALFAVFSATYFWFPKMFGRVMNERLGQAHFWLTFFGAYCLFIPMHFLGLEGLPRRYSSLGETRFAAPLLHLNTYLSVAAFAATAAQLLFLANFFWSMFRGAPAAANPWQATTLEWGSGESGQAVVYRGAYEYSVPGAASDFITQDAPGPAPE
jgi:cytochrome c oxidase subunit 1